MIVIVQPTYLIKKNKEIHKKYIRKKNDTKKLVHLIRILQKYLKPKFSSFGDLLNELEHNYDFMQN